MVRLSEETLANISGGVKSFDMLSKDGKVVTSVCAVACAFSFVGFCAIVCKNVVKKLVK